MMDFKAVRPQGASETTTQSDYRIFYFKRFHETVNYATPAVDIMDVNVNPLSFCLAVVKKGRASHCRLQATHRRQNYYINYFSTAGKLVAGKRFRRPR
jgi:hypothetical protein